MTFFFTHTVHASIHDDQKIVNSLQFDLEQTKDFVLTGKNGPSVTL